MDKIRRFLINKLNEIDVDEDMIPNMDITTKELALSSLELVDIATALNDAFHVSIKLLPNEEISLTGICEEVEKQMG